MQHAVNGAFEALSVCDGWLDGVSEFLLDLLPPPPLKRVVFPVQSDALIVKVIGSGSLAILAVNATPHALTFSVRSTSPEPSSPPARSLLIRHVVV
jgi:hypothetical protein